MKLLELLKTDIWIKSSSNIGIMRSSGSLRDLNEDMNKFCLKLVATIVRYQITFSILVTIEFLKNVTRFPNFFVVFFNSFYFGNVFEMQQEKRLYFFSQQPFFSNIIQETSWFENHIELVVTSTGYYLIPLSNESNHLFIS